MNRTALTFALIALLPTVTLACEMKPGPQQVTRLMDCLSATKDLEAVHGDRFPDINPYGSYGSPYVLDFIDRQGISNSILFLARKKNQYFEKGALTTQRLVKHYDYFLVFATQSKKGGSFEVSEVLHEEVGLMGMSLYHGSSMNLRALPFRYLDGGSPVDMSSADASKFSTPILISSLSSTEILINYGGKWIHHVEVEE